MYISIFRIMVIMHIEEVAANDFKKAIQEFYGIKAHGKLKKEATEAIIDRTTKLKAEINGRK